VWTPGRDTRRRFPVAVIADRKKRLRRKEWFRMVRPGDRRPNNAGAEVKLVLLILGGGAVARV
jgi:hypothetical protein